MRHVHKVRSPRRWSCKEHFTWELVTLMCSLAPPPPSNPHKTEPAETLSLDWAAINDGAPLLFSCQVWVTCSDIHRQLCEVYGPQCMDIKMCESGSESSCMDVKMSMMNSILVGLRFRPKQLQKWSKNKKCLKIGMWQFVSCANRSLKSVRVWLATWQESSKTRVYEKSHSTDKSAWIAMVIMSKNSWKSSLSINVTFIVNKRVFCVKK